jgi:hypothetical protein
MPGLENSRFEGQRTDLNIVQASDVLEEAGTV